MATIEDWLLDVLRDPETLGPLKREGEHWVGDGAHRYASVEGIPVLVYPRELEGSNREMERLYRWLAPFYEWNERFAARHLLGMDMDQGRADIVGLLVLTPGMSLLEVSPGPGVFQPWLRKALGPQGRLTALDLSMPMLKQARWRHAEEGAVLIQGNGEHLPFADASFDALFHFGGVNLFTQPQRALAEFVRVLKPGGLLAYGDEGFAPDYPQTWRRSMLTRMNPGYLRERPVVPAGLVDVVERPVYGGLGYLVTAKKAL